MNGFKCSGVKHHFGSSALRIDQVASMILTVLIILASPASFAHTAPSPSKSGPVAVSATLAVARSPKDMTSGSIIGGNWMVTFHGLPADWTSETGIANQIGIQELFHPQKWDQRQLAPSIMFSFSHKVTGDETAAENMASDVKRSKAGNPATEVISAPVLDISSNKKAPVRIFEYPQGWDRVIYSEEGDVLYVSTLHCVNAAQCAPFGPTLDMFVESLDYTENVTVIDKREHR